MSSKATARLVWPSERRPRFAIALLVAGGLAGSIIVGGFTIDNPVDGLPGVALGSETILATERTVVLFAAWLLCLVAMAKAWAGELPVEISGRGVRYAEARTAQDERINSDRVFTQIDMDIEALNRGLADVETVLRDHTAILDYMLWANGGDKHEGN